MRLPRQPVGELRAPRALVPQLGIVVRQHAHGRRDPAAHGPVDAQNRGLRAERKVVHAQGDADGDERVDGRALEHARHVGHEGRGDQERGQRVEDEARRVRAEAVALGLLDLGELPVGHAEMEDGQEDGEGQAELAHLEDAPQRVVPAVPDGRHEELRDEGHAQPKRQRVEVERLHEVGEEAAEEVGGHEREAEHGGQEAGASGAHVELGEGPLRAHELVHAQHADGQPEAGQAGALQAEEAVPAHEEDEAHAVHEDPHVLQGQPGHAPHDLGGRVLHVGVAPVGRARDEHDPAPLLGGAAAAHEELAHAVINERDERDDAMGVHRLKHRDRGAATAQREPVQGLNAEQRRRHARQPCRHAQVALHAMLFCSASRRFNARRPCNAGTSAGSPRPARAGAGCCRGPLPGSAGCAGPAARPGARGPGGGTRAGRG